MIRLLGKGAMHTDGSATGSSLRMFTQRGYQDLPFSFLSWPGIYTGNGTQRSCICLNVKATINILWYYGMNVTGVLDFVPYMPCASPYIRKPTGCLVRLCISLSTQGLPIALPFFSLPILHGHSSIVSYGEGGVVSVPCKHQQEQQN